MEPLKAGDRLVTPAATWLVADVIEHPDPIDLSRKIRVLLLEAKRDSGVVDSMMAEKDAFTFAATDLLQIARV